MAERTYPVAERTRPALFLDRDGVVNREVGYLSRQQDVVWVPGLWELCARATALDWAIVIVTNQSGIARGLYSEGELETLMQWMTSEFRSRGFALAAWYYCPHHPVHGVGKYQRECDCRKPAPGMLLQAARDHALDLRKSVMVGDRCSDVAAANAAGVGRMFLLAGTEERTCTGEFVTVASLEEVSL